VGTALAVVSLYALATPLHGDGTEAASPRAHLGGLLTNAKIFVSLVGTQLGLRIIEPERPGIAGTGQWMLDLGSLFPGAVIVAPWTDKHIGRVFVSALYLIAEEQCAHFAFDQTTCAAKGPHRAADDVEGD